ncbi:MAG: PAS domain S-box protein [Desulfobacteraceae bacterium]|uniref:PAS domain S-box protein n=1 Tax=Candidatus Desulfacyla euxinica TaxID=2841693 RepID=A0A8J6N1P8_9DELT|nr:PAS domain S-box protein [Candidatus Desulfacyla euxinica]MBL6977363.1 PAS domain S-box protein [Desulfobacteraceae bacterium]
MKNSQNQSNEVFKSLSEPEITRQLPKEITNDAFSILIDAINSTVGGVIITDLEGFIRFVNPSFCKMFDYSSADIIGKNATELFATKEVRKFTDVITIIDISRNDTEEFVVEMKDGKNFVVEVSASNVTSASGELVGRIASFVDITKRKQIEADREELIKKLQDALDKIRVLRGILPICASCKKIRDDSGYWCQIESYIKEHSEAVFSHGICPDCAKKLYPEFYK